MYPQSESWLLSFAAHCEGEEEEEACLSQEALGVDRACGNDFIGKACDIFSPLVCGSWRRLEVGQWQAHSVALASQHRSSSSSCLSSQTLPRAGYNQARASPSL